MKTVGAVPYSNDQPAVMQPTQEVAPPTYTRSAQQAQLGAQPTQPGAAPILTTAELQVYLPVSSLYVSVYHLIDISHFLFFL